MRVTVITEAGQSAIVQYEQEGFAKRSIVPKKEIDNGEVKDSILAAAPVDGFDFESAYVRSHRRDFAPSKISVQVANELRNAGIWTAEDLTGEKRILAKQIFQSYYARLFSSFLASVANAEEESLLEQAANGSTDSD